MLDFALDLLITILNLNLTILDLNLTSQFVRVLFLELALSHGVERNIRELILEVCGKCDTLEVGLKVKVWYGVGEDGRR